MVCRLLCMFLLGIGLVQGRTQTDTTNQYVSDFGVQNIHGVVVTEVACIPKGDDMMVTANYSKNTDTTVARVIWTDVETNTSLRETLGMDTIPATATHGVTMTKVNPKKTRYVRLEIGVVKGKETMHWVKVQMTLPTRNRFASQVVETPFMMIEPKDKLQYVRGQDTEVKVTTSTEDILVIGHYLTDGKDDLRFMTPQDDPRIMTVKESTVGRTTMSDITVHTSKKEYSGHMTYTATKIGGNDLVTFNTIELTQVVQPLSRTDIFPRGYVGLTTLGNNRECIHGGDCTITCLAVGNNLKTLAMTLKRPDGTQFTVDQVTAQMQSPHLLFSSRTVPSLGDTSIEKFTYSCVATTTTNRVETLDVEVRISLF